MPKTLSIIVPCYNERDTILELLHRVEHADAGGMEKQIVVVDDRSTDGTRELLRAHAAKHTLLFNDRNRGKGYSIRRGLAAATGDVVLIQDADLEYNPDNYTALVAPILAGEARVVYGSRERNENNRTHSGFSYYAGGMFLSWLTNRLYGSSITDEPTCYKVFDADLLRSIPLRCERFEFCPEVTAKVLRRGVDIVEIPIDYYPRRKHEGKKIGWRDGLEAAWTLLRYRLAGKAALERKGEL